MIRDEDNLDVLVDSTIPAGGWAEILVKLEGMRSAPLVTYTATTWRGGFVSQRMIKC